MPDTLLRPQEPAAPQEPTTTATGVDPKLGSRAWSWYAERYLPYAEPDERAAKLARAFTRDRILNGDAALEKLKAYPQDLQDRALKHYDAFQSTLAEATKYPLRAPTIFREHGGDRRLMELASTPEGMEALKDLAAQAGDAQVVHAAEDALNFANLARVGQITLAASTADPEGAAGLPALAQGGIDWGKEIEASIQAGKDAAAEAAMDMRRPIPSAALNRVAVDREYQEFAFKFSKGLAEGASKVGLDYTAPAEAPKDVAEAKRIFMEALPVSEQFQEKVIGKGAAKVGFYGPQDAQRAMAAYARLLFAVQSKMPEKAGELGEIQAILNAYAAGESAPDSALTGIASATLKPAFWVLEKIGRVDQAANALLYGTVGTTAPVRFRFADGSVFTDITDAAEYSQKIMAKGGEYRSPQWLIEESVKSRQEAMFWEAFAAEKPLPGQQEQGVIAGFGRVLQTGVAAVQEGVRRVGDAIFGGEAEIDASRAARPVVEYGVTELPYQGGVVNWDAMRAAFMEGEGKFIGDTIRENTSTKADDDIGYRMTGWVTAEATSLFLSPWMLANTGQVTARSVNAAKEAILGEKVAPVLGASKEAPRVYHFTDGVQMNPEWSALREIVAERLGAGKSAHASGIGDLGGSGEIADVILTEVKNSPGQSWREVVERFKNRPGVLDDLGHHAEASGVAGTVAMRAAGMDGLEYAAARNRAVAQVLDDALEATRSALDQMPLTFGYKHFWDTPARRDWLMRAKRGIYFGKFGVPLGPISARVGQAVSGAIAETRGWEAIRGLVAPVSALGRSMASVFVADYVATQTPAAGGLVQDAVKIPYRIRKAYERQYRSRAAVLNARSQMATYSMLQGADGSVLPVEDRKLLTILVESGRDVRDQARVLVENADIIEEMIGVKIAGATQAERYQSALDIARRLSRTTGNVQLFLADLYRSLAKLGVMSDDDYIRDYVTHFYHGPAGSKALRPTEDLVAELAKRRAAGQPTAQFQHGTSAILRVGPESVVDAIRLGGLRPELDLASLLHYRTTQALKVELDAVFSARIASTLGIPMLRGKEAAVRLAQAARRSGRYEAELGIGRAVLRRPSYARDLAELSKVIRDKAGQMERAALSDIAGELGIPVSKFLDERMLTGAMMESEEFLRRAASGKKGILDKMMSVEARKSLRGISREMLAHRHNMRVFGGALRDLGIALPDLAEMSDVELSLVAKRASEALQQRVGRVPALERDLRVAREAHSATKADLRSVEARVREMAAEEKRLLSERGKIAKEWDKAKAEAAEAGLVVDDLALAKSLDDVRRIPFEENTARLEEAAAGAQRARGAESALESVSSRRLSQAEQVAGEHRARIRGEVQEVAAAERMARRELDDARAAMEKLRQDRASGIARPDAEVDAINRIHRADAELSKLSAERAAAQARLSAVASQARKMRAEALRAHRASGAARRDVEAQASVVEVEKARLPRERAAYEARQQNAYDAYKKHQGRYVSNAQARRQIALDRKGAIGDWNKQKSLVEKLSQQVAAHEEGIKTAKAKARLLDKERRAHGRVGVSLDKDLDRDLAAFLEASRGYQEARRAANAILQSPRATGVSRALGAAAKRVAAHGSSVRAAVAAFSSKYGVEEALVRQRALTPRTVRGAVSAFKKQEAVLAKPPEPSKARIVPPAHSPARSEADLLDYAAAQDGLDALEMSRAEQSALLWEVFGARTITEVPIHELRMLTDGPMRASIVRMIADPLGDSGRVASRVMDVGPDSAARKIAPALGVSMEGSGEAVAARIEAALSKLIADAEKGSERAQKVLNALPASDLAQVYRYNDLGRAAQAALAEGKDIRGFVGTMSAKARSDLERTLRTTFIPLEMGLAMKTLMGEGVFRKSDAVKVALASRFGDWVANGIVRWAAPLTRGFKTAAIGYRASMLPGRRNSLFDGVRGMIQLGMWGFFSPSARKAFLADIKNQAGMIQTASGLVDRGVFQTVWEQRGASMFGAATDSLDDISRALSNSVKEAKSQRFIRELEEVGAEGRREKGINLPVGASVSSLGGGGLGAAVASDWASGAALGFGFYGFLSGATGLRRVVHSSGQIATKAEWALPIGPQAMERLDNTFRYFVYWTYVKSGMTPADAMDAMLRRMRDFTNLTPAERRIVQHIATATPFLFYNFTKQNGIAQLVRFLDKPANTTAVLRFVRDASDISSRDEDARAFWQNISDTIVRGGKAWNIQDEATAAIDLLAPVIGLIEGARHGKPLTGLRKGLEQYAPLSQSAPVWKELLASTGALDLPLPLAARLHDRYGTFDHAGIRVYVNEQGVPRAELSGAAKVVAALTGMTVALNDMGRIHASVERSDWTTAIAEAFGMGRVYDRASGADVAMGRFDDMERAAMEASDFLEANEISGSLLMDAVGLSPEEKAVVEEVLRWQNGKYVADIIAGLQKELTALRGRNRRALAGRLPTPERN